MAAPLLSNVWYRVADVRPKVRPHARLHRHRYRDRVWYLLQDPASGRINRFSPAARLLIGLMDGRHSVAELWEIANRRLGDEAPTQDEIIQLLGQLHAADLLQSDVPPDAAELFARGEREERARARRSFGNPMAIRIPLWDPDSFLDRFPRLVRLVWSRWGALLWLVVVLPAMVMVPPHWPELSHNFSDRLLAVDNLFVLYLVFPVLKIFHEMGHASATKAGGGEVHDLGVILLVLLPVPYVEASAATTFKSKYRRALVGAAGVLVELFLAALAFYAWLAAEPGLVRAILFNVMVIAGVSTLIFNGNPLLRYDAYYVLADLTEIPNLAGRSLRYWSYLLERYLLGVHDLDPPDASLGEKAWFLFYGAASSVYRVVITVFIALFIAGRFFFVGVLLALWAVFAMAVLPVVKGIRHLASSPRLQRHRPRAIGIAAVGMAALIAVLVLVPVPSYTQAEGVVWLDEDALVRAGVSGFLAEFVARPGEEVRKDQVLIRLQDPGLQTQLRMAAARVQEWTATYATEFATDRAKAQVAHERLDQERKTLAIIQERASYLAVRARTDGIFVVPQMADMAERWYRQGDLLGYVLGPSQQLARVVVPQDAIDRVRVATDEVTLRLVDRPGVTVSGRIIRAVPGGEELLPSRALATDGGGSIVVDPRETRGPKAMQRMFQFDVEMRGVGPIDHFGQRVYVRFQHAEEPLMLQWYRAVRLLFLSRFSV